MSFGHWSGDRIEDHEALCANSCGRVAETEVPAGVGSDGTEHVDLVCHPCRAELLSSRPSLTSITLPPRPVRHRLRRAWRALTTRKS